MRETPLYVENPTNLDMAVSTVEVIPMIKTGDRYCFHEQRIEVRLRKRQQF
jgi:hypothetical protein